MIKAILLAILINFCFINQVFAWLSNPEQGEIYLYIEHQKEPEKKKIPIGELKIARYKDIDLFQTLTIDTRFNTPVNLQIIIDPFLDKNELTITDQYGHADIFNVSQKGQNLTIQPTSIFGYRVDMVLRCKVFQELVSHGDNQVIISGLVNTEFMLVIQDTSTVNLVNSTVRQLHIQANNDSVFNGLGVSSEYTDIYANDRAVAWIDTDYANIRISKGALVKCERFPLKYNLNSQKTNSFIREPFSTSVKDNS